MLPLLSDELLLEAYQHAVRLKLEREFVHLLHAEIRRRQLPIKEERLAK
ncbi:Sporulation inhibitor A [Cohnella sp. OV330]|nr:sporulation histidine kinase inhibitor Sda [Cohnella sp. GbtcB17]SFA95181.1 Sporulation inhibitor A [Cohnella sp. OV330]